MENTNFKKFGLNFFLISITFFHVIKFESEVYSAVDYNFYPNLPTIELVVHPSPKYNLQSVKNLSQNNQLTFEKNSFNFFQTIAQKYLFKLSCFSLIQQISNEQLNCSPTNRIITLLQKNNHWHSSDNDPFPVA
jgi:hypothetical protein